MPVVFLNPGKPSFSYERGVFKKVSNRTVLYVEDNPTNFNLVERILALEGFTVLHASDGLEGIKKAIELKNRLDLILMDINLPAIDGYETTQRLRSIPGFEGIPILAVTVNTLKGDRSRSLAAGCDGYIAKPIDVSTFADEVRSYLDGRKETLPPAEEGRYLREHNKKLVERLEQSVRALEESKKNSLHSHKLANIGEMAAGLMHEIKNPLSSISFMAEYLLESGVNDVNKTKYLERIINNVTRITALSQGVSSFARVPDEQKGSADLGLAIEEVLTLAEHELKDQDVFVRCDIDPGLPPIWAAEGQFHHIFMNLLRNSVQALAKARSEEPAGVRRKSEIRIKARSAENNAAVLIEIADNGTGVPDSIKHRLFEPFFTTKGHGEGTGLGLYIVMQVVGDLGGSISVADSESGGALFTLRFPAAHRRSVVQ